MADSICSCLVSKNEEHMFVVSGKDARRLIRVLRYAQRDSQPIAKVALARQIERRINRYLVGKAV